MIDFSLAQALMCPACGGPLQITRERRTCCSAPEGSALDGGIVLYDPALAGAAPPEAAIRDRQAGTYLLHGKFPIQLHRISRFVARHMPTDDMAPVLDLGCGPGPTTKILARAGFSVVAVDFSRESLRLNADACRRSTSKIVYVHADLNRIEFSCGVASGLMMADFLQHLGSAEKQAAFLRRAFSALKPGGWFFLSFFNTNIVNRLKGDIEGSFSGGIRYRRMSAAETRAMLPPEAEVLTVTPMNIFHGVLADRLATSLPWARHLARMTVLTGRKRG
jgi:2-polyprenyl-3-methyl-5-hydroxy-6-metoxy-1,4-benzoquinol methylase